MRVRYAWLDSPVGRVVIAWSERGLERVGVGPSAAGVIDRSWVSDPGLDCDATRQVRAYFEGERTAFDLPVVLKGTDFQRAVWGELARIPYAETISYGDLALRVDRPGAARAVGMACNRNPVPIVVPCHRVIGADGRLVGFGGGIAAKRGLLALERQAAGVHPEPLFTA